MKILVCTDYLVRCYPKLFLIRPIRKTEIIAREFFYKIHIKKLRLNDIKYWVPSLNRLFFSRTLRCIVFNTPSRLAPVSSDKIIFLIICLIIH